MAKKVVKKPPAKATKKPASKRVRSATAARSPGDKILVIVESPTKARTIRKFLGPDYLVESCMGHVRDLPQSAKDIPIKFKKEPWAHLGVNVDQGFAPVYCVPKNKQAVVSHLRQQLADARSVLLATDEDREGESISWHLIELLAPKVPTKRMVFHEITKEAIQNALSEVREIDENLVKAQEARRILDRLVGYTISPLLWKKVAYGLSAGRVQSVAVRLIAEKEIQRLRFHESTYWDLSGFLEKQGLKFEARLVSVEGTRVASGKDFDPETGTLLNDKKNQVVHLDAAAATRLANTLDGKPWKVTDVEQKPISRRPAPPFITSTLQQEANRKLGLSSRETMQVAQKLYERGMITYMRTDSTALSAQAVAAARRCIKQLYGDSYLPAGPRDYSAKKVKGAQEAHEAIRPAGTEFTLPDETGLSGVELRLYDLIWKRTVASQMVNSEHLQVVVKFAVGSVVFSASGMTIEFPGFLKAYVEGHDDPEAALEDREVRLPSLAVGEAVTCRKIDPVEHKTKAPARFTEASLVQFMEKAGIGRPSTYASIIGTIQDRGYVRKVQNALVPTFTALVVSELLRTHLPKYVELGFTSGMEQSLDDIAEGELDAQSYLSSVYSGQDGLREEVGRKEKAIDPEKSRQIDLPGFPGFSFRVGRYGAYVCRWDKEGEKEICASIPDSQVPGDLTPELANRLIDQKINGADSLGRDPETGLPIYVLTGRYGPYVQLGEVDPESQEKPKRMALLPGLEPERVTLETAIFLLRLPRVLGQDPDTGEEVKLGLGRFGPYVVRAGDFRSVPRSQDFFAVDLAAALDLLSQPKRGRGGRGAQVLRDLGAHPASKLPVQVLDGKYGPYVKCGKTNASLPEGRKVEEMTLEEAVELIDSRSSGRGGGARKERGKRATVSV